MKPRPSQRLAAILFALACASCAAASDDLYWARFADGTEVTADRIDGWDSRNRPRIAGRAMLDPASPLQLLHNTRLRPVLAGPRVEFLNGDVLAGRVTGFGPLEDLPDRPTGPGGAGLAVVLTPPLHGPAPRSDTLFVRPGDVRRIVLSDTPAEPLGPGTILLRGAPPLLAQAVRWTAKGVQALTSEGIRDLPLTQIDQIDMPLPPGQPGEIDALLRDAVFPCPAADSLIGRITTANGTAVTCRVSALGPAIHRDRNQTCLRIQPAWALHALQVPLADVWLLSCRAYDEVPLSLLPARSVAERTFTGFQWPWQRNRSVQGDTLASGTILADLGVGTHSYSAVAFRLPDAARELRFLVGLDRSAGAGGCVILKVFRDRIEGQGSPPPNTAAGGSEPIWQSGFLRGQDGPLRVGPLPCQGAREIVLVTEFAHDPRPAGADPADIRDHVDWLLPTVRLAPPAFAPQASAVLEDCFDLGGWFVAQPGGERQAVRAVWNSRLWRWEPVLDVPPAGLTLLRRVRVQGDSPALSVSAAGMHANLTLGAWAGREPLKPAGQPPSPPAPPGPDGGISGRWDLSPYRGKEIVLTVRFQSGDRGEKLLQRVAIRSEGTLAVAGAMPEPPLAEPEPVAVRPRPKPLTPKTPVAVLPRPKPGNGDDSPPLPPPKPGTGVLVVEGSSANYAVRIPTAAVNQDSNGQMTMTFRAFPEGSHRVQLTAAGKTLSCTVEVPPAARVVVSVDFPKGTTTVDTRDGTRRTLDLDLGAGAVRMQLVLIPAGKFLMGSPPGEAGRADDEGPRHEVTVSRPFFLGVTEVTRAQYQVFLRERTAAAADEDGPEAQRTPRRPAPRRTARSFHGFPQTDESPAIDVSWDDAVAFCQWLGHKAGRTVRLPTEAQWEYACRAGAASAYQWGDDPAAGKGWCNPADQTARARFRSWTVFPWEDGFAFTSPVAQFKANAFGLYDMHGNVLEWCADWYASDYYAAAPKADPPGPAEGSMRVLRGGSWAADPQSCRCANRFRRWPQEKDSTIGLRVAADAN